MHNSVAEIDDAVKHFRVSGSDNTLKDMVVQLVDKYVGDRTLVLTPLTAWQCLVLVMTSGVLGQTFTPSEIAYMTGVSVANVRATCGSVALIRATHMIAAE